MFGVKEARVVEAAPFMAALSTLHGASVLLLPPLSACECVVVAAAALPVLMTCGCRCADGDGVE